MTIIAAISIILNVLLLSVIYFLLCYANKLKRDSLPIDPIMLDAEWKKVDDGINEVLFHYE